MLNNVKNLINRKKDFLESRDILFGDLTNGNIDEMLIGELPEELGELSEESVNDSDIPVIDSESDDVTTDVDDDIFDGEDDDILNTDMSDNSDGIKKSEIPANLDDDDELLKVTVDLRTSALSDVLPIPPVNAADAIEGATSANVDDGFGDTQDTTVKPLSDITDEPDNDDTIDTLDKPESDQPEPDIESIITAGNDDIPEPDESEDNNIDSDENDDDESDDDDEDKFTEAINIDGEEESSDKDEGSEVENNDAEGNSDIEDESSNEESEVTAAVMDKISDADVPEDGESTKEKLLDAMDKFDKDVMKMRDFIKKNID